MKKAIFPGSFDPFTIGHADIVKRGLLLFDHIVIAVGHNTQKNSWIPTAERVRAVKEFYKEESRVSVEEYCGLTIDFAKKKEADFILRSIRSVKDYEYELDIADINRKLSGIETVLLLASPEIASISSSVVRELAGFGHEIHSLIPQGLQYNNI
jgi:pantetheine-phosphate adenylyltransferase